MSYTWRFSYTQQSFMFAKYEYFFYKTACARHWYKGTEMYAYLIILFLVLSL